jgi:hypothetical protein
MDTSADSILPASASVWRCRGPSGKWSRGCPRLTARAPGYVLLLAVLLLGSGAARPASAQLVTKINTVKETATAKIDAKGDMAYAGHISFPTEATYGQMKKAFPSPYVLLRNVLGSGGVLELSDAKASYDDAKKGVDLTATVLGWAVNHKGRWQARVGKALAPDLVYADDTKAVLVGVGPFGPQAVLVSTLTVDLPSGAKGPRFDVRTGFLSFTFAHEPQAGTVELDATLRAKPRLMSALYKVYGNEELSTGAFWTAKALFTNAGPGDVTDLHVSYRIGDYTGWSPETEYSLVPAGGHVVDLYYPVFKKEVADLRGATPVDLEMRYTYVDGAGKSHTETTSTRITILGVSQFEYSNLPEEERTDAWTDKFSNAPLLAAFVTRMDEPVRAFGGLVAQASGGAAAGQNDDEAKTFLRALWDLERQSGISYQWGVGYSTEYSGVAQELKYPRDVLRDKSGTCIELALLFAAVAETGGLRSHIVLTPGHAFPVIQLPSGQMLPVESTGLAGAAVGRSASFEEAVNAAIKESQQLDPAYIVVVDVEDLWRTGVTPPELPHLPSDALTSWGYKLPRSPAAAPRGRTSGAPPGARKPIAVAGRYRGMYKSARSANQVQLVLAQEGDRLRGQLALLNEGQGPCSGQVTGQRVTLTADIAAVYGNFSVTFTGVYRNNTLNGSYQIHNGGSGSFSLAREEG